MQLPRLYFVSILVMATTWSYGQSRDENSGSLPNTRQPGEEIAPSPKKDFIATRKDKGWKLKRQKVTHTAQYEFYKRVEIAAKDHQRALKRLYQPQYSNFLYYGHRRLPKKHTPDKMRFCKECGIRH